MRITYHSTGAALDSVTLISTIFRVVGKQPGASREALIEAALDRLGRALDEIAQAVREPNSSAGSRLRADLAEQLNWLVRAGHVHEVTKEGGEVRYTTR